MGLYDTEIGGFFCSWRREIGVAWDLVGIAFYLYFFNSVTSDLDYINITKSMGGILLRMHLIGQQHPFIDSSHQAVVLGRQLIMTPNGDSLERGQRGNKRSFDRTRFLSVVRIGDSLGSIEHTTYRSGITISLTLTQATGNRGKRGGCKPVYPAGKATDRPRSRRPRK